MSASRNIRRNNIRKSKIKKQNPYRCEGCKQEGICVKYLMNIDEKIGGISNLEFRCIYTFFSWILLAYNITSGTSIFTSLIMFSMPLLIDYIKFIPNTTQRKVIKKVEMYFSMMWIFIGILGQIGVLELVYNKKLYYVHISQKFILLPDYSFKYKYVAWLLAISVGMTYLDKFLSKSKGEDIIKMQAHKLINSN